MNISQQQSFTGVNTGVERQVTQTSWLVPVPCSCPLCFRMKVNITPSPVAKVQLGKITAALTTYQHSGYHTEQVITVKQQCTSVTKLLVIFRKIV